MLKARFQAVWRAIAVKFAKLRMLAILLIAAICLSGCVDYDLSIHMADQNHGEIVQHIRLAEQFANFNESVAQDWLKRIERRTRELGGRTQHLSTYDLVTTIPFYNGAELVSKFNQFFQPPRQSAASSTTLASLDWPELAPQLHITQDNFLLVERNRLTVDLDLRSLGLRSSGGNVLLSPAALLNLNIRLTTPWGADSLGAIAPELQDDNKHLMWALQPGRLNHIETVFWVPSPLGIGAVAIALLVALGIFLKSVLPSRPTSR